MRGPLPWPRARAASPQVPGEGAASHPSRERLAAQDKQGCACRWERCPGQISPGGPGVLEGGLGWALALALGVRPPWTRSCLPSQPDSGQAEVWLCLRAEGCRRGREVRNEGVLAWGEPGGSPARSAWGSSWEDGCPGPSVRWSYKVQCQPLPRTQRSVPQGRGSVNSARMMGLEPHTEEGCR